MIDLSEDSSGVTQQTGGSVLSQLLQTAVSPPQSAVSGSSQSPTTELPQSPSSAVSGLSQSAVSGSSQSPLTTVSGSSQSMPAVHVSELLVCHFIQTMYVNICVVFLHMSVYITGH